MVNVLSAKAPGATAFVAARASLWNRTASIVAMILVVTALLSIQALIGGTRLLFAFPAYGALAIAGVCGALTFRRTRPWPDQICLASAVVFFGYILMRAAASPVDYLARYDIYSVIAGLVIYLLTACVLTDSKTRLVILLCLLAAGIAHVIVGAIQFHNADNWMPLAFLQRFDYGRRASGFYICPNHLAGLLEVLGIFGLSITVWSRWPTWSKLLLGYFTMIFYVGIVLTGSRGGYLSVLASLVVFLILSVRIARAAGSTLQMRIGAGALVMAALAGVAVFLVIQHSDYLSDRTRNVIDNKNVRLDFWQAAVQQWKLSPLIGTGSRTYLFYGRKFRADSVQMDPVYVHNDYLQLLAEYGVAGFVAFLIFFIAHLRRGLITARRLGPRRILVSHRLRSHSMALNVGALGALAAYAVHSGFDFNLHIPANVLVLAFVFGILANPGVEQNNTGVRNSSRLLPWFALLLVLAVTLGLQVWRLLPGEFFAERARMALRDQQPFAALSFARKGLEVETQNPQLHYYLGRARFLAGEQQRNALARASFNVAALSPYESARQLAPLDETYPLELGLTYDSLNRFAEAEWMFDEARQLDPKSEAIRQYYEGHLERWRGRGNAVNSPPAMAEPAQ
jgi:O-antigen ligase